MSAFVSITAAIAVVVLAIACWPLWRGKQSVLAAVTIVIGTVIGIGVYNRTSNYDPNKPGRALTLNEQLGELRQMAASRPNEPAGWQKLCNALRGAGDPGNAIAACEKAYAVSDKTDAGIMLDYAEALAQHDPSSVIGEAGHLIENALRVEPTSIRALWYGGSVAAARGDRELAATRFEAMLRPDTPPEIRDILVANIRELRGQNAPPAPPPTEPAAGKEIAVDIRVADSVGPLPDGATLFLIATTAAGGPPLGVVRQRASVLPATLAIGDGNAMIQGRNISSQETVRLVARVSTSGQPAAQPGDRYGQLDNIDVASTDKVVLTIDQTVK
ncbi:MAG: hypothetical protein AAGH76_04035 [Pseudomonadota bacterium]